MFLLFLCSNRRDRKYKTETENAENVNQWKNMYFSFVTTEKCQNGQKNTYTTNASNIIVEESNTHKNTRYTHNKHMAYQLHLHIYHFFILNKLGELVFENLPTNFTV